MHMLKKSQKRLELKQMNIGGIRLKFSLHYHKLKNQQSLFT